MASTEEQDQKAAWLAGCSVEEWRRRGNRTSLQAREHAAPGGFAIFADRRKDPNYSEAAEDESLDAAQCAAQAKEHLDRFLAAPHETDAHEHLARCGAMVSAALSRCARDSGQAARIARGMGLHSFRG